MKSSLLVIFFSAFIAACFALPTNISKRSYSIQISSNTSFCSFMPPKAGDNVGSTENDGIPMCTASGLGGSVFPSGFIKSAHYAETSNYVQVTGKIDRSKYSLKASDGGGQYDNKDIKGVTCNGYKYFVNLIEPDAQVFCIRCCKSQSDCNLGRSTYGCESVVPGNYS